MDAVKELVQSMPWYGWVAIVAILGGTVKGVVASSLRHQERMAMIKQGVDPDSPSQD